MDYKFILMIMIMWFSKFYTSKQITIFGSVEISGFCIQPHCQK